MISSFADIDSKIDENFQFIKIKKELYNDVLNLKYSDYLKTLDAKYYKTYLHIFLIYLSLFFSIYINIILLKFFSSYLANVFFFIINSFFVGLFIHSLQQALHVGMHYELCSNKATNDKISLFIGILTGVDVKQARIIHMKHHTRHAEIDDPENSYFFPLTFNTILKFFTGISIVEYCLKIDENIDLNNQENKKLNSNFLKKVLTFITLTRIISISIHASIVYLIYLNSNLFFALSWVYGFLTFFPFLASLLNIVEHGDEKIKRQTNLKALKPINRLFEGSFFSKYIYAPFGAYKHAIHHWDPTVHHAVIDKVENFLLDTQIKRSVEARKTTIFKTIKAIF